MYTKQIFAAGALLSAVAAVPMAANKRDIVWVTETDVEMVTMPVTQTVWVNPGESAPTQEAHYAHSHGRHHSHSSAATSTESSAESTSAAAPSSSEAASSSSSVYVAPTTSSSSVYVAPTTSSSSVYVAPTTSSTSEYVAPTTSSTSEYVAPTTSSTSTSVWVAPTTTSAPAPLSTSSAPSTTSTTAAASGTSPSGATYTGDITYYDVGLGSCGWTNTDSDAIVAIPHGMMNNGINPNNNPLCGEYITISYAGATHQAKIVDTCGGCDGASIDLSPTLFQAVAPEGDGRVHNVEWWFNN